MFGLNGGAVLLVALTILSLSTARIRTQRNVGFLYKLRNLIHAVDGSKELSSKIEDIVSSKSEYSSSSKSEDSVSSKSEDSSSSNSEDSVTRSNSKRMKIGRRAAGCPTPDPCREGGQCTDSEDPYGWGYMCNCNIEHKYGGRKCEIKDPCNNKQTKCPQNKPVCIYFPSEENGRLCYETFKKKKHTDDKHFL